MKTKTPLIPLLMLPVITLLALNPLAHEVLDLASSGPGFYLKHLLLLVTLLYGLYLNLFRAPKKSHWMILLVTAVLGLFLSQLGFSGLIWLIAFALLFSGMRVVILERPLKSLPKDLGAFFVGVLVATLLTPLSLIASIAAFLLVQMIYELRLKEETPSYSDRFMESHKTAERILKEFS